MYKSMDTEDTQPWYLESQNKIYLRTPALDLQVGFFMPFLDTTSINT